MAVPKRRVSHTRKRKRASNKALVAPTVVLCPNCKAPNLPHVVCSKCGYFRGEPVIEVAEK